MKTFFRKWRNKEVDTKPVSPLPVGVPWKVVNGCIRVDGDELDKMMSTPSG